MNNEGYKLIKLTKKEELTIIAGLWALSVNGNRTEEEKKEIKELSDKIQNSDKIKGEIQMNSNVKRWYLDNYPTDELGTEINNDISFNDVIEALEGHKDVYDLLEVDDSIVRERVFEGLSDAMNVDYAWVYDKWMEAI